MKLRALVEKFRSSFFFLPSLFVLAGISVAVAAMWVDAGLTREQTPEVFLSTVDSAREVLSTIAGAIITVAAVVFSMTVVSLQLASSQFSPRILRGFLRNRFQQAVIGFVMATFTYCLLVLRSVKDLSSGGETSVPSISVSVAVGLAVLAAVSILAFVDRSARAMQIGNLLQGISEETVKMVGRLSRRGSDHALTAEPNSDLPTGQGHVVAARTTGWVQQIDVGGLLSKLPDGGTVLLSTRPGAFIVEGTPLCTVWPFPEDPRDFDRRLWAHVGVGRERTMQEDVSFGIRQLVDVALRALSPGVNDLTTATEAIAHLGAVMRLILLADLNPQAERDRRGRRLVRTEALTYAGYVDEAFGQLRVAASGLPSTSLTLLETMGMLREAVVAAGHAARGVPLVQQARLLVKGAEASDMLPEDLARIRDKAREADLG